jgi:hypothetical protein
MIRTALEFIKNELEAYIVEREQDPAYSAGSSIVLRSLSSQNGNADNADPWLHVTVSLIGVEEELREGKRPYFIPADDKQFFRLNPPVDLNLFVLFGACSATYSTSLRDLSDVIGFFQSNPVFDARKFPALNASVNEPDT